ncbi:hypothetical protein KJ359_011199 [Pestalotiopsis sp. 9143b]|nr:hypothetical protein KJ359_011199 [Pestalotiopsis sp. 9143b]
MAFSPRSPPDVLATARPNGGTGRTPQSIVGHKRTGSGRIESKENLHDEEGASFTFSSPDLSVGSATKSRLPHSPIARPVSLLGRTNLSRESPRDSQIPRPKTSAPTSEHLNGQRPAGSPMPSPADISRRRRQPLGLKAAFQLAEAQEFRERSGSSSSSGSNIDLKKAFEMANAEANRVAYGSPSPAPRSYRRRESIDTRSNQYFGSVGGVDLGHRLRQFDKNHQIGSSNGEFDGLFTSNGHAAPKVAQEDNQAERQSGKVEELPRGSAGPGIDFPDPDLDPLSPVDYGNEDLGSSPIARPTNPSPEKSFGWDLDADFTAGDLQVSNSPRIKLGRNNSPSNDSAPASPIVDQPKRTNDKLDKIRELEIEAANADIPEEESSLLRRRTNPRLDEIRAREMAAVSPRALSQSKLDEIRAKNAEARSRSSSPEEERHFGLQSSREKPWTSIRDRVNGNRETTTGVGKSASPQHNSRLPRSTGQGVSDRRTKESFSPKQSQLDTKDDTDLLRRLTEATSPPSRNLPQPRDPTPDIAPTNNKAPERVDEHRRLFGEEQQSRDMRAKSSRDRLTVDFAGTLLDKAPSETDPVDRIEAEMDLFALAKDQSEKSSSRAKSPGLSDRSSIEETPKAKTRVDPLTLPTPRVMGAYVETPATVKVERDLDWTDVESDTTAPQTKIPTKKTEVSKEPKIKYEDTDSSDKGKTTRRVKRRTKRRLVNTAKIPTVKEDLRMIKRQNHIEDSTLDDFDDLLDNEDIDPSIEDDLKSEDDDEKTWLRMSKSLQTGLQGIRSAKLGIERLEDKISQSKQRSALVQSSTIFETQDTPMAYHPSYSEAQFGFPIFYRRYPTFRLTPLGLVTFLLAIWYAVESVFCSLYVDTYNCPSGMTCDWSPNEPYFPYAAPFMLDEWATGGKGRALAWRVGQEFGDVAAEVSDWVTGHDFTKDEVMYMDVWDRRRHRRRLNKRGLYRKWIEPVQHKYKFQAWRNSWNEKQRDLDEGIPMWEDESMNADEVL